jgi:hypothetical protein
MKSRRSLSFVLAAFVALAAAVPIAAPNASAKSTKTTATMDIFNAATLGGKQIEPGIYKIEVGDSTVTFLQHGKMVAEAPVEWKHDGRKASMSNIVTQNDQIKEIHFGGKAEYIEVMD